MKMKHEQAILFPPYLLDTANACLQKGGQEIVLRPKTFAVLHYLVTHPDQLVTKEDLLAAVWPDTYVSAAMPKICIGEIRHALNDNPKTPQFIETVSRRGYRFIAPLTHQPVLSPEFRVPSVQPLPPSLVGREAELEQLYSWLEKAWQGERQVIFVTGEAGIGKTTVVDAFVERVSANEDLRIIRGQCLEHYGVGEAYMPVLEALGRLCREPGGEDIVDLLAQHAPNWLVQMPSLLDAAALVELQRRGTGAATDRMLREMAETMEVLTAQRPLVLVLEDLQWSDVSTLELLSSLARRREPARLVMIGTFRPVEIVQNGHPLKGIKQELQTHQRCEELALEFLTQAAVGAYLGARFAERQLPGGLAQVIHHRTDGNPLFMVNVTDYLVGQGVLRQVEEQWTLTQGLEDIEVGVPENLWQMLEKQLAGLSREAQKILEAGSVGGIEFSAAAIAAGLERDVESVEEQCERLVRQGQLLQARDIAEWPDGTVSAQYRFIHGLYQEVLYTRVVGRRRVRLHQRIGERLEDAYGKQASEIAAELAMHFEVGRDPGRAVRYLRKAAENALRRSANQEAIIHLNKGLELLKTLPDTPQRAQQELTLLMALGLPLMTTKGYAAPEVESAYTRARELCQQMGEAPQLFSVLGGLRAFYSMRAEFLTAHDLSQQIFGLSQRLQDPAHLLWGHQALGDSSLWLGEVAVASTHLEQGLAFYRFQKDSLPAFRSAHDPSDMPVCGCHSLVVAGLSRSSPGESPRDVQPSPGAG